MCPLPAGEALRVDVGRRRLWLDQRRYESDPRYWVARVAAQIRLGHDMGAPFTPEQRREAADLAACLVAWELPVSAR